jgi:hypothetical protein
MGRNFKPNMWRGSGPEPVDFAQQRDPLHTVSVLDGAFDQQKMLAELISVFKEWITNHSVNIQPKLDGIKQDWCNSGGSLDIYNQMEMRAINDSGYAKALCKEIKEMK